MKLLQNLFGILGFRSRAIHSLAESHAVLRGIVCFALGFLTYVFVRNSVYADLPELMFRQSGLISGLFYLNIVQSILFLAFIYSPAVILAANTMFGDGVGFSISGSEYRSHLSALFPLWGLLFLVAAPLQWLIPHFLIIGMAEISVGILIRSLLLIFYTLWAVKQLNSISYSQALGVLAISCLTFPVYYLFAAYWMAIPVFLLILLIFWAIRGIRRRQIAGAKAQEVQRQLQVLTENPHDADAHYQLGLIYWNRKSLDAAQDYFLRAIKIAPQEPEYHYWFGRTCELKNDWRLSMNHYEEAYRLNPEYGLGIVCREAGKGYLHTGNVEKGREFLDLFLSRHSSDIEGRYWFAVAMQQAGDVEQMRFHLNVIREQARSSPGFFKKHNREWIFRARDLMRDLKRESIG
jgi:tetratricopeptide (TPR) repeat protein